MTTVIYQRLAAIQNKVRGLYRDRSGSYVIMTALLMPVIIGFAGLGTDMGLWLYKHRHLQSAADSGAVSAATAIGSASANLAAEAEAVTASYGYMNGEGEVIVTVNRPPLSGKYTAVNMAVEVIVSQPQPRYFSMLWDTEPVLVVGRAVALSDGGLGCVLALNQTVSGAVTTQGSGAVTLNGCSLYDNSANACAVNVGGSSSIEALSVGVVGGVCGEANISTELGVHTGTAPAPDPYADASYPPMNQGCFAGSTNFNSTVTLNPGRYCNGVTINAGAEVTLNPGVYYIDRGTFRVNGGATLQGEGVTLVFTSSTGNNWATARFNGGANINLSAPTSGSTAGIVVFGDRDMPAGTEFRFNGGTTQEFGGAIYLPKAYAMFAGGSGTTTGCTQLIADTLTFSDDSSFSLNCEGFGTGIEKVGVTARLVE